MQRTLRRLTCLAAGGVLAAGLASCGGGDDDDTPKVGKLGGDVTVAFSGPPDSLDPSQAYTTDSWQTMFAVYTGLLTYEHAEGAAGAKVVPGLADAMPKISRGGRRYELRLRPNLKYSNGKAVEAADFEHAIKRVLNLESDGSAFYLSIVGAEKYVKDRNAKADIPGIVSDEAKRTIRIDLTEPDGRFPNILAMSFASLVPGTTPFKKLSDNPPPGVGPYKFDEVKRNQGYKLTRVPTYRLGDLPRGKVQTINIRVVNSRRRITQDTIRNRIDIMGDPPAADQIREVRTRYGDRFRQFVTNSTYYFFLNEDKPPFNDLRVRQAANFAMNQAAFARLYGGLMQPSCNLLPPGVRGYEKIDPCPYGDPSAKGNLQRARDLIKQAGAEGADVTVYGSDEPEFKSNAEAYADVLSQIGLNAKPRILEESQYRVSLGDPKVGMQAGITSWFQDFPHPSNFFQLVSEPGIPTGYNAGFVRDKTLNAALSRIDKVADIDSVTDEYAKLDKRVADQAHVVEIGNRLSTVFMSARMNFGPECNLVHPVYLLDYTSVCLK